MSRYDQDPAEAVAYWAEEAIAATTARNEAIIAMRKTGASLRQIAETAGLSHGTIARIIDPPRLS